MERNEMIAPWKTTGNEKENEFFVFKRSDPKGEAPNFMLCPSHGSMPLQRNLFSFHHIKILVDFLQVRPISNSFSCPKSILGHRNWAKHGVDLTIRKGFVQFWWCALLCGSYNLQIHLWVTPDCKKRFCFVSKPSYCTSIFCKYALPLKRRRFLVWVAQ